MLMIFRLNTFTPSSKFLQLAPTLSLTEPMTSRTLSVLTLLSTTSGQTVSSLLQTHLLLLGCWLSEEQ